MEKLLEEQTRTKNSETETQSTPEAGEASKKEREHAADPNFLDERSRLNEEVFSDLISHGEDLNLAEGTIEASGEEITTLIQEYAPERWKNVTENLEELDFGVQDLGKEEILDKFLNVDSVLLYEDKKHPVDITSGSSTTIKNKRQKMRELREVYTQLGCAEPIVCTWREAPPSEETALTLLLQLENQERAKKYLEYQKHIEGKELSKKERQQYDVYDIRLG